MQYPIILNDRSCKRFAAERAEAFKGMKVVVGIGGGDVIDKAKVLALPGKAIVFPTTASGAAMTRHAVVWTEHAKLSIATPRPIVEKYPYAIRWSAETRRATMFDFLAHCIDSLNSTKSTVYTKMLIDKAMEIFKGSVKEKDLVEAGNLAGEAIDITGTQLIHQMSYPLTLHRGIPHGIACGIVMRNQLKEVDIWKKIESHLDIARLQQILST